MAAKAKAKAERKGYVVPADAASEPRAFALPNPAYQAEVDGVMMYEYHVDAAEVFLQWRLEQPSAAHSLCGGMASRPCHRPHLRPRKSFSSLARRSRHPLPPPLPRLLAI